MGDGRVVFGSLGCWESRQRRLYLGGCRFDGGPMAVVVDLGRVAVPCALEAVLRVSSRKFKRSPGFIMAMLAEIALREVSPVEWAALLRSFGEGERAPERSVAST